MPSFDHPMLDHEREKIQTDANYAKAVAVTRLQARWNKLRANFELDPDVEAAGFYRWAHPAVAGTTEQVVNESRDERVHPLTGETRDAMSINESGL